MPSLLKTVWKPICKIIFVALIVGVALWLAIVAQQNSFIKDFVYEFGYIGVLVTSFVSGLNLVFPLPVTSFVPLFIESGLNFWITMFVITVGLSIADSVAYVIGHSGRELATKWGEKKLFKRLDAIRANYPRIPLIILFFYSFLMKFISIQEALNKKKGNVALRGWIHRERGSNKLKFIVLRDSTNILQCVIKKEIVGDKLFSIADKLQVEASITLEGELKEDKRAPTGYELQVKNFEIIGESNQYPITKDQSPEWLLDMRHLSIRSQRQTAIFKIRSAYIQARDEFFRKEGYYRFDTPILQPTQSEGGSTVFEVKYYKQKTFLAQTWQLYAEAAIFALEKIFK